jgi:3' terminal RNA ribose 2'-O-methyltransferase Hen1
MLLSITTTAPPATDLGFLLHKHPDNVRTEELPFGTAHVFFPEATAERCTATLLVEVDPVRLVRGRGPGKGKGQGSEVFALAGYVNDRPYAASSFLSVALGRLFRTALAGRCEARPGLADAALPFTVDVPVLACRGGEDLLRRCFEPLGHTVDSTPLPLDERIPAWGDAPYRSVRLRSTARLADVLAHLYVLLPVLDDEKHYWVGDAEVDKLLARAEPWLGDHPERELIVHRYLRHRRSLAEDALARLVDEDAADENLPDTGDPASPDERPSLNAARTAAVVDELRAAGAARVADVGCGEGRLLAALLDDPRFTEIVGMDVSSRALDRATNRLQLDKLSDRQRARLRLLQGSLTYRDRRLAGFDALVAVEVVEHLDPGRLAAFEAVVFGAAAPPTVVLTTPNREHNVRFPGLATGGLRHRDHRFEWTRAEFRTWAGAVAARHGYAVRFEPVGADDPEVGPPTQLAVFAR